MCVCVGSDRAREVTTMLWTDAISRRCSSAEIAWNRHARAHDDGNSRSDDMGAIRIRW